MSQPRKAAILLAAIAATAACSDSGNIGPIAPRVEFTSLSATVTPVSQSGAEDGQVILTATIDTDRKDAISRSGFEYRTAGGSFTAVQCGRTLSPSATVRSLKEGVYEYMPFVFTVDDEFIKGEISTFVISTDAPTSVVFSDINAIPTAPVRKGDDNGFAELSARISLSGGKATLAESGFAFKATEGTKYTFLSCGESVSPSATAEDLSSGPYDFYVYARLSDGSTVSSTVGRFTVPETESSSVSFDNVKAVATGVSQEGKSDGKVTLSASITVPSACGTIAASGFRYRLQTASQYTDVECGKSSTPSATVSGLAAGSYAFIVYARLSDGSTVESTASGFTIAEAQSTSVTFDSVRAVVSPVSKEGASDGKAVISAVISLQGGTATATETGGAYRLSAGGAYTKVASKDSTLAPSIEIASLPEGTFDYYVYVTLSTGETRQSAASQFRITTPTGARYDWAELPSMADADGNRIDDGDATLYYAYHLCPGGERNAQGNGKARNYTVCYSSRYHCPVWVSAPRHAMYEQKKADRTDAYAQDPDIPGSIQYSSKSTGGGCNKGHMLGSAERLCSAATNRQVFYYTNIAPQGTNFNTGGGAWNNLEDHIDGLVCSDTLYVVIGCYFKEYTDRYGNHTTPTTIEFGSRNDVTKPTMFYYALLRTKKGNSGKRVADCTAGELQCVAIVMSHGQAKGHKPQAKDLISVAELEALTGFTYFTNIPSAPKSTYSASDWDL